MRRGRSNPNAILLDFGVSLFQVFLVSRCRGCRRDSVACSLYVKSELLQLVRAWNERMNGIVGVMGEGSEKKQWKENGS